MLEVVNNWKLTNTTQCCTLLVFGLVVFRDVNMLNLSCLTTIIGIILTYMFLMFK